MAISKESSGSRLQSSSDNSLIVKLSELIQANLNNDQFGVDRLAQAVGMSRSSLHRKLQKSLGISTSRFIREYRLKKALEILSNEEVTASEAAHRVGFSSPTYFNTSFHKFYGFTPGEVKSRNIEGIRRLIGSENTAPTKNAIKKKLLWIGLFVLAIAISGLYFYNTDSKETEPANRPPTGNEKSIAVLPLKNWTGNPDLEYVSDGMTDAVISGLAKITTIDKVTPFSSVLNYKDTDKTAVEIAKELGVSKLLQGNLQISGNQIKINLQMIDANSNNHVWSEEYMKEWQSDEIFRIQAEVVEGIAKVINVGIDENALEHLQKIPTKNKQAYSYYLQAEFQRYKANKATFDLAKPLYEKAIALDSNFVEAYHGLATIWNSGGMVWGIYDQRLAWKNAKHFLQKALKIDPTNEEVHEELYAGYFYYDWDFEKAEEYYQAVSKNTFYSKSPILNTDYAIKTGRYEEAIKAIDEHLLRDPSIIGVLFCLKAEALMLLGNIEEAIPLLDDTVNPYGDNWFYLREAAKQYFYLGQHEKSKVQLNKMLAQFPDFPPILMWLSAVHAQMDGNSKKAVQHLAELHEKYHEGSSGSPAWFIALYYCTIEDYEKAFEWLQNSYDRHEVEMTWLREEPLLAPVRDDSRYKELYRKVGFSKIGLPPKVPTKIENAPINSPQPDSQGI